MTLNLSQYLIHQFIKETIMSNLTKNIKLNVSGSLSKNNINNFNPAYAVRNDCQVGQWKVGDDKFLGATLDIAIIATNPYYGALGKTKPTSWLQVFFIGSPSETKIPTNTVCVTYLKTQSLTNLTQVVVQQMEHTDPGLGIFTASFTKKVSDLGNYYVVDFTFRDRVESEIPQLELIAQFLEQNPLLTDNVPATMVQLTGGVTMDDAKQLLLLPAE